jgi:hypothetical protein
LRERSVDGFERWIVTVHERLDGKALSTPKTRESET